MKSPAVQFYWADFVMDTQAWTCTQLGAYIRLLAHEWVNGSIPTDISGLARIAGTDPRNMQKMWSTVIAKKFTADDTGMYVNRRLEEERTKQNNYIESQRESGKRGAEKRWKKHSDPISDPNSENIALQSSSSSSSSLKEKTTTHFASKSFDAWWVKYPHRNGKKVTKDESLSFLKGIKFKDWDLLLTATENYEKSEVVQRGFAKDPIRFLKKSYWKDWVDAEHTPAQIEDEEVEAIMAKTRKMKEKSNE